MRWLLILKTGLLFQWIQPGSPIGHDWKYFDMNTFTYVVEDSIAFFVMNSQKDVYKLVFSVFDYTVGKVVFSKSKVHASSVGEITPDQSFFMFPNPASDAVQINMDGNSKGEEITITDLNGKVIFNMKINQQNSLSIPVNRLNPGVYLVTVKTGTSNCDSKAGHSVKVHVLFLSS